VQIVIPYEFHVLAYINPPIESQASVSTSWLDPAYVRGPVSIRTAACYYDSQIDTPATLVRVSLEMSSVVVNGLFFREGSWI